MKAPDPTSPARSANGSIGRVALSPRARSSRRGYTVVELMMAVAVLAIGVSGLIAMQKVTVSSNLHAKNLALASAIGQSWIGHLEAEAAVWPSLTETALTPWIAQGRSELSWFRPNYDAGRQFGPSFDALGNPMATDVGARFCVDLRMEDLSRPTDPTAVVRAEVRVVWRAEAPILASGDDSASDACDFIPANVESDEARRSLRYLYLSSAVRTVKR